VKDAREALNYGKIKDGDLYAFEFSPEDTLGIGEKEWLLAYRKARRAKPDQKTVEIFSNFIDEHLAVEVSFCSIWGDCWTKCSTRGRCG
jgi:hypothetical protein